MKTEEKLINATIWLKSGVKIDLDFLRSIEILADSEGQQRMTWTYSDLTTTKLVYLDISTIAAVTTEPLRVTH